MSTLDVLMHMINNRAANVRYFVKPSARVEFDFVITFDLLSLFSVVLVGSLKH